MNSLSVTGNLGQDCETKYLPSGEPIVSFSLAVKAGYGDKANTFWARCSMFGKRGEAVAPFLMKGQQVGVVGELNAREWTDRDGNKRTSIEVRVNDLTLLGKRDAGQERQPIGNGAEIAKKAYAPAGGGGGFSDMDDDIPFAPMGGRKAHYL